MHLVSLSLRQFRNFSRLDLEPANGVNVFIGSNGAGKSNILEGIAVLAAGQSHRGAEARHWLQEGKDEAALTARVEGEESLALELRQKRGRVRQFRVNNRPILRHRDWAGQVPLVSFSPEEMDLVKGEPAVRRRAVNAVLAQVDGDYAEALGRYTKLLEERNAALRRIRDGLAKAGSLEPWDLSLLKEGARLTVSRHKFLAEFAPRVQRRQSELSGGRDRGAAVYRPSFHLPAEEIEAVEEANRRRLADLREGEIALGSTLIGPHRDEIEFRLDDDLAKTRASQGQARTLALSWKWEERLFLKERVGRVPISLLDDVFSELDPARRGQLTELLFSGGQCFLTLTDFSVWGDFASSSGARVFEVAAGSVRGRPVPLVEQMAERRA
ncbi:MAG: DNA replication and repair protein RecF [Elusimicrobia bacterium]|nr:DNA replication and repair protein RecF [Elusimicrobiota bacterium]